MSDREQAVPSPENPIAGSTQIRILVELQVISSMLHQAYEINEDLGQMRNDIARSLNVRQ